MRKVLISCLVLVVALSSCGTQKGKGLGYHLPEQSEIATIDTQPISEEITSISAETSVNTTEYVTEVNIQEFSEAVTDRVTEEAVEEVEEVEEATEAVDSDNSFVMELAETYNASLHLSKQGLYEHLLNYDKITITEAEAQYAIDHIDADFKENAVKTAIAYRDYMGMSGQEIYDMLQSDTSKFTSEEARYAIEHMN